MNSHFKTMSRFFSYLLIAVLLLNLAMPIAMATNAKVKNQTTDFMDQTPICTIDGVAYLNDTDDNQNDMSRFECALCFVVSSMGFSATQTTPPIVKNSLTSLYKIQHKNNFEALYRFQKIHLNSSRAPPLYS